MKIIPKGSIVVTEGGQFLALRRGVETEVHDDLGARLITGGNAVAVKPAKAPAVKPAPPALVETAAVLDESSDASPAETRGDDEPVVQPKQHRGRQGKRLNAAPENK